MLYLLDASVLITANNSYYPVDTVPEFWGWLHHLSKQGLVLIPTETFEEIKDGPDDEDKDLLFKWIQTDAIQEALLLKEDADQLKVQRVVSEGYAADLTDDQIEQLGRDPFLISYALDLADRCIVTAEQSKPSKTRQNRQVPDVCGSLGVKCCNPFAMYKQLGFSTNWEKGLPST